MCYEHFVARLSHLSLFLALCLSASGQVSSSTGAVEGWVIDSSQSDVVGAEIDAQRAGAHGS